MAHIDENTEKRLGIGVLIGLVVALIIIEADNLHTERNTAHHFSGPTYEYSSYSDTSSSSNVTSYSSSASKKETTYYPYEGMSESRISSTACGPYSKKEVVSNTNQTGYHTWTNYHWYVDHDRCYVMTVMCSGGVVESVQRYQLDKYWNADGSPNFTTYFPSENSASVTLSQPSTSTRKDPYSVQDFDDPDDFASYWMEDFLDDNDADDDEEALDDAYNDAWDYWWDHHK